MTNRHEVTDPKALQKSWNTDTCVNWDLSMREKHVQQLNAEGLRRYRARRRFSVIAQNEDEHQPRSPGLFLLIAVLAFSVGVALAYAVDLLIFPQ